MADDVMCNRRYTQRRRVKELVAARASQNVLRVRKIAQASFFLHLMALLLSFVLNRVYYSGLDKIYQISQGD